MSEPKIIALPYIDIQHDALSVFDDVEQGVVLQEDIWISGYKAGSSSVHGKARVEFQEGGGSNLNARDGLQVKKVSKNKFLVSIPALEVSDVPITFPRGVIHPPYKRPTSITAPLHINSLAWSSSETTPPRIIVAGPDGYLACLPGQPDASTETEPIILKGHVGDVLDVKVFPSGQVILSTSSDLSIRIWGLDGSNPRIFKGHTRAITSSAILGVGKQIFSASRDGTIRQWDVSKSTQTQKWEIEGKIPIEELILLTGSEETPWIGEYPDIPLSWVLLAFTTDNQILGFTDSTTQVIWRKKLDVPGNLVCASLDRTRGLLATGHTSGVISFWKLADTSGETTLSEVLVRRNESAIYSLCWVDGDLFVGTAAGLPCRLQVIVGEDGKIDVSVKEELAGWEAVGIEAWTVGNDSIYCAGGEGGIRRYQL